MSSQIVVSRPSRWSGRAVAHKVFIEGVQVAKVRNDSSVAIPGPPGTVRVQTRITGSRSQEVVVTLGDGAAAYLVSKPNSVGTMVGAALGGVGGFMAVRGMHGGGPVFLALFGGLVLLAFVLGRVAKGWFITLEVSGVVPGVPPQGMAYPQAYPQATNPPPYPQGPYAPAPAQGGPGGQWPANPVS